MKRNKKIMSMVAGAAIASQLLTVGSVVTYAQTTTFKPHTHDSKDPNYGNIVEIYSQDGKNEIDENNRIEIRFGAKTDNKLHVNVVGSGESLFLGKDYNREAMGGKDYLTINIVDGEGKKIIKQFHFEGNDPIKKVVDDLNNYEFKKGYGLQFHFGKTDKNLEVDGKDPHVRISGFVNGTGRCFVDGISQDFLNVATFVIGDNALEYRQYTN